MKKALILAAFVFAALCAKAQQIDTLSYRDLRAEIVSMNNQMQSFKDTELLSICVGLGGTGLATAGMLLKNDHPDAAIPVLIMGGVAGITSLAIHIIGYTEIKRDRLEMTPDGLVIKIGNGKKHRRTSRPY